MKRYQRTAISQYIFIGLILIALIALSFLNAFIMQENQYVDDFILPWSAGRVWLLEGGTPYDDRVADLARQTISETMFQDSLPEPLLYTTSVLDLVLTLPFSLIPYEISRVIWMTSLEVVCVLIVLLGLKISGWKITLFEKIVLAVLFMIWFPGAGTILSGHRDLLVIFLVMTAIYCILREQDKLAGFILSLTFSAFTMTPLILLLLLSWSISRRRWSIIISYFSGLFFLVIISLLLMPQWPLNWLGVLLSQYQSWDWVKTPLMSLANLLPGVSNYISIFLHLVFAIYFLVLLITLLGKSGRVFTWKVLTTLAVAFLFHVQVSAVILFLLLPGIFLVFRFWSERWKITGRILSWIIVLGLAVSSWVLVFPLDVIQPWGLLESFTMWLPVMTLVGLIWIRWWAINIPKLPFEKK